MCASKKSMIIAIYIRYRKKGPSDKTRVDMAAISSAQQFADLHRGMEIINLAVKGGAAVSEIPLDSALKKQLCPLTMHAYSQKSSGGARAEASKAQKKSQFQRSVIRI